MRERRDEKRIGVGAASIVFIFVSIALAALALLSLFTAKGDLEVTKRNSEMIGAYYQEAYEGQKIIAQIDEKLFEYKHLAQDQTDYDGLVAGLDLNNIGLEIGQGEIAFDIDETYGRKIGIILSLLPYEDKQRYSLAGHILTYDEQWESDIDIQVFQE